jgi:hypothetical protein
VVGLVCAVVVLALVRPGKAPQPAERELVEAA